MNLLWQKFYAIGLNFVVVNGQTLNSYRTIWSLCSNLRLSYTVVLDHLYSYVSIFRLFVCSPSTLLSLCVLICRRLLCDFFKKWTNPGLFSFFYFRSFLITNSIIQIEKSVDGVVGIRTWGCRMVGADKTMELWRPPFLCDFSMPSFN